jgi:hypothetical protein
MIFDISTPGGSTMQVDTDQVESFVFGVNDEKFEVTIKKVE